MVDIKLIEDVFNNIVDSFDSKCRDGSKGSGGTVLAGKGEPPRYEVDDGGLTPDLLNKIADDMAERWGLEVSIDEKGKREVTKSKFSLWDANHNTLIRLNKILKHQDWIDFTNNGKGAYDLDEVLQYYDELDDIAKTRMSAVLFETNNGSSMNRLYHGGYGLANTIEISTMVYHEHNEKQYQLPGIMKRDTRTPSQYNMKQVMAHEAGHASERVLTKEQVDVLKKAAVKGSINKVRVSQLTTPRELEVYNDLINTHRAGDANDLSGSKEWRDAQDKNKVRMSSSYAASYTTYGQRNTEDYAETYSAVSYRNASPEEKAQFRMKYTNGKVVGWDEFVSDHKATYQLACDYVDGKIKHSDLHSPFSGEKFS